MSKRSITPNGTENETAQPVIPAPPKEPRPSAFSLLSRAIHRASSEEHDFLMSFLESCANKHLTIPEIALAQASAHFDLTISVENVEEEAGFYRGLRYVLVRGGWLQQFIDMIFSFLLDGKEITMDTVAYLLDQEMSEMAAAIGTAQHILRTYPTMLAADIRNAVTEHPELLA
jgi:hypothetical protein